MLYTEKSMRLVTHRCLIATDVDKTILAQVDDKEKERIRFARSVAPQLIASARMGINICFLTGNSMKELSNRILKWLLEQLCLGKEIYLLERFHFFCNAGGVYAHFPSNDKKIQGLIQKEEESPLKPSSVLRVLTEKDRTGELVIRPRFIDSNYIGRTIIPDDNLDEIDEELRKIGQEYYQELEATKESLSEVYDLRFVSRNGELTCPYVERRRVRYGHDVHASEGSVQITLKPMLSFRHALSDRTGETLFKEGRDLRSKYITKLIDRFDKRGLGHFSPRPGGRTSIDVTMEKLDKAYALQYLIDNLNVQGHGRKGQLLGSNTIYLGDEVIVGGGNDYVVSRIPGLLVLAVNEDRHLVPFAANIYVPHTLFQGPDASLNFLTDFNRKAEELLRLCEKQRARYNQDNAVVEYKRSLFVSRIEDKLKQFDSVSSDELQIMHALVSLMCRKDTDARQWIAILVNELNDIMAKLAVNRGAVPSALGDSFDESEYVDVEQNPKQ